MSHFGIMHFMVPSLRNCTRVPYYESRKNLLLVVLAFLRPCKLRSLIRYFMPSRLEEEGLP